MGKVDPFGQNTKKKVIKPTTIMFQADGPEKNLGKAKLADIASAKFRRGEVKADN